MKLSSDTRFGASKYLLASAAFALVSCSTTPKVKVDQDPQQDFSSYRTFAWAKNPPMSVSGTYNISPIMEKRITNYIKTDLEQKGYVYTESLNSADFAIAYTIGARDKVRVDAYPDPFYGAYDSWGWGRPYYPGPEYMDPFGSERLQYSAYNVTQGSLAVDAYDVKRRQPVWHGASSKNINDSDVEGMKQDVASVTDAIMAEFPDRTAN